jgi:hypothetical protein
MSSSSRTTAPRSLADALSGGDGPPCPIPATHDRLHECHYWWHEMARQYHEPGPFRYSLGAFLQAARNVTWVLQKEQGAFSDFSWYDEWREKAKNDPLLRWLHDARNEFVKQQALEPQSWLEMRCVGNPRLPLGYNEEEGPFVMRVNAFTCTDCHVQPERSWAEDHSHEYVRHWEMETLPGRELLEATAEIYDRLDELVEQAHKLLGHQQTNFRRRGSPRALPCMEDTATYRTARTVLRDGHEVWEGQPPSHHGPETHPKAIQRHRAHARGTSTPNALINLAQTSVVS